MPHPTPFHPRTSALCTSLFYKEWAGYHAVRSYETCHVPEYFAVRHAAGLIDVTPLYKIAVRGPEAARFLAFVTTRDVTRLVDSQVAYCTWTDVHGKLLDDGTITRFQDGEFRLTSADPSFAWLSRYAVDFDVVLEDESESIAALALQGPRSREILAGIVDDGTALEQLGFFRALRTELAGMQVDVTRTGYTGDLGYELWCSRADALTLWDTVFEAGQPHGLLPLGLDALDVLRVEAGFILNSVDYRSARYTLTAAQTSSPYEIGLGWTVHTERDPFIGQAALQREKEAPARWKLVGLDIEWDALEELYEQHRLPATLSDSAWRDPVPVYLGATQIGFATSGAWSPTLKKNLALATIDAQYASLGTQLSIEVTVEFQRRTVPATVVKTPFFDPERKRSVPALHPTGTIDA